MKLLRNLLSLFVLVLLTHSASMAQKTDKVKIKSHSNASSVLTAGQQKDLNENFKLNSPTVNQDLKKPFRISGYGIPGATVEINITPVSTGGSNKAVFVTAGKQSPYKVQNYTTQVGSNGTWSLSEVVNVKFRDGATGRRVMLLVGQSKNGLVSKKPIRREIKLPDEKKFVVINPQVPTDEKIKNEFKVYTAVGDGITASTSDNISGVVGTEPFKMKGTAAPKSKLFIEVYYSGTKTEYTKSAKVWGVPVETHKKVTQIKNKKLGTFEKNIGEDGNWQVLAIDPYESKSGDVGTELLMNTITIHFSAMNGDKQVLKKTVTLKVIASSKLIFFKQ